MTAPRKTFRSPAFSFRSFRRLALAAVASGLFAAAALASGRADEQLAHKPTPQRCVGAYDRQPCEPGRWPSFTDAQGEVMALYINENFPALEAELAEIDRDGKHFIDGTTPADAAWRAFNELMQSEIVRTDAIDRLSRWRKAVPDSAYVDFAYDFYMYQRTLWDCLCADHSNGPVDRDQIIDAAGVKAEEALRNAPAAARATFVWNRFMLALAVKDRRSNISPYEVFNAAIARWPRDFQLYDVLLTRLTPEAGGNWILVDEFIKHWADVSSSTEGRSLYARLYINLHLDESQLNQTKVDWGKMRTAFDDLVARYPHPSFKNAYLSSACHFSDWDTYTSLRVKLPLPASYYPMWTRGTNYVGCDERAGYRAAPATP